MDANRVFVDPADLDVLCGSGHFVRTHPGNIRLRRIIEDNFDDYLTASSKLDKSSVVDIIVADVVNCDDRRFRVLKKDPIFSTWYAVSTNTKKVIRDKITSSLRVMSKKREEEGVDCSSPDSHVKDCYDCKF